LKHEISEITGLLNINRIVSKPYPINYGFIPQTISGDNDPLDVLVFSSIPLQSNTEVRVVILGVIRMVD
jgi:inorganic pyrophosphatase